MSKTLVEKFDQPTTLPPDEETARSWQRANRHWWESHPMRYDWRDSVSAPERSREWYAEIDRRFFGPVREFMPWSQLPFDELIPYQRLAGKNVLEIGVGMGAHAQLLSNACGQFVGLDLTKYAADATRRRLDLFGLSGLVCRMDAEQLAIASASMDFVWSWGVIHHSGDTFRVLKEIHRVLRPGGSAVIMVYHRNFWNWWVHGLINAIIRGRIIKLRSLHRVIQETTDGAVARYYKPHEWRELCREIFEVQCIRIYGQKVELFPLPAGRLKNTLLYLTPDAIARFFCNKMRQGSFLVSILRKT